MQRGPILAVMAWKELFSSAVSYEQWLIAGESQENQARMEEARRTQSLDATVVGWLNALPREVRILAIAEDWCGDVVRHVPVLQKLVDSSSKLHIAYVTRHHHPEVFVRYLTNGGEAIPKFVFFNADYVECGNWGPMPTACRRLIARGKACGDLKAARAKVSAQYAADDDCRVVIDELMESIAVAAATAP